MRSTRRRSRHYAVAGAALAAAACLAPATAGAALPDGRGYEQVSPVDKNGYDAPTIGFGIVQPALAAEDGDGMTWASSGPYADAEQGLVIFFRSSRGSDAWDSISMSPPMPSGTRFNPGAAPVVSAYSDDVRKAVFFQGDSPGLVPGAPDGFAAAVYLRDADGELSWLSRPAIPNPVQPVRAFGVGASADLGRIVIQAYPADRQTGTVQLVPEDLSRTVGGGLYEVVDGGALRAVGLLPDGSSPEGGAMMVGEDLAQSQAAGTNGRYRNRVSQDGSSVYFMSPDPGARLPDPSQLYVRVDGEATKLVTRSELDDLPSATGGTFVYGSPDGSKVWFTSDTQLTTDAPGGGPDVYRFDVATEELTYEPDGAPLVSSEDGERYLYFLTGDDDIWAYDHGRRSLVAADVSLITDDESLRATSAGTHFTFRTSSPLPDFNNGYGMVAQLYVYDVAAGRLSCASCMPSPTMSTGSVGTGFTENAQVVWQASRVLAEDGSVYFDTPDQLVQADQNAMRDVYQFKNGVTRLLSGGTSGWNSYYQDSGADGQDVFFSTREQLVPQDIDSLYDVYDARVGGGFPTPPPPPAPCTTDCQGPLALTPFLPVPETATWNAEGNAPPEEAEPAPEPEPSLTVGAVSAAAKRSLVRSGSAVVRVRTNVPGTVRARASARVGRRWANGRAVARRVTRAGAVSLTVRIPANARRQLATRGALRVRIVVSQTGATSRQATFVVRAATRQRRSRARNRARRAVASEVKPHA